MYSSFILLDTGSFSKSFVSDDLQLFGKLGRDVFKCKSGSPLFLIVSSQMDTLAGFTFVCLVQRPDFSLEAVKECLNVFGVNQLRHLSLNASFAQQILDEVRPISPIGRFRNQTINHESP